MLSLQYAGTVADDGGRPAEGLEAGDLAHRYLWGPAVDQILADEQVESLDEAGEVVWPLADPIGTVRDLVLLNAETGIAEVANHRVYDSFGNLRSQTSTAVDCLFAFTGRPFDTATGLQNNWNRWYDPELRRWASEDPIGLAGGDGNCCRYVRNSATGCVDQSGLAFDDAEIAIDTALWEVETGFPTDPDKSWTRESFFGFCSPLINQTRYGCGGLAAWRCGLEPEPIANTYDPFQIKNIPGAERYATFAQAQAALAALKGKGIIVAYQYSDKEDDVPFNFATFHGTYWEYANHGGTGMKVIHKPGRPKAKYEVFWVIPLSNNGSSVDRPDVRTPTYTPGGAGFPSEFR